MGEGGEGQRIETARPNQSRWGSKGATRGGGVYLSGFLAFLPAVAQSSSFAATAGALAPFSHQRSAGGADFLAFAGTATAVAGEGDGAGADATEASGAAGAGDGVLDVGGVAEVPLTAAGAAGELSVGAATAAAASGEVAGAAGS